MAKVLLDIGAHSGETLEVAMAPRWAFDRIHCIEPAPQCWARLEELADERVQIHRFGLWSSDATLELHDPGMVGASLFESKRRSGTSVEVELRDAADWFEQHVSGEDEVVVKLNCEGAECDILDRLLAAGELSKVDEMVVHFDVRKVPGQAHREAATRAALDAAEVPYRPAESIFFGRNVTEKTENWLAWYEASGVARWRHSVLRRAEFAARTRLYRVRHRDG